MNIYGLEVTHLNGERRTLSEYQGKVLLIVNTASNCGFTPQYQSLERMYQKHAAAGLVVLGFPCNQFGAQEPGDAAAIGSFCERQYAVTFPLFDKIEVNGPGAHPLYQELKHAAKGILGTEAIKWNFTKFLVNREGKTVSRHAPKDTPESLEPELLLLLSKTAP